jgi:hypothetical protein
MGMGNLITTLFVILFLSIVSIPLLSSIPASNSANTFRAINQSEQHLLITGIYQPLNTTVYSSQGLGASIINTLGFAFIFPAILQFATALAQIPTVLIQEYGTLFTATGLLKYAGLSVFLLTSVAISYFGMYLLVIFVSGWNKYDYWGVY